MPALIASALGGDAQQRVLYDVQLDVLRAQLAAQVGDLGDGEALGAHQHGGAHALQLRDQYVNLLGFRLCWHSSVCPFQGVSREKKSGALPA